MKTGTAVSTPTMDGGNASTSLMYTPGVLYWTTAIDLFLSERVCVARTHSGLQIDKDLRSGRRVGQRPRRPRGDPLGRRCRKRFEQDAARAVFRAAAEQPERDVGSAPQRDRFPGDEAIGPRAGRQRHFVGPLEFQAVRIG